MLLQSMRPSLGSSRGRHSGKSPGNQRDDGYWLVRGGKIGRLSRRCQCVCKSRGPLLGILAPINHGPPGLTWTPTTHGRQGRDCVKRCANGPLETGAGLSHRRGRTILNGLIALFFNLILSCVSIVALSHDAVTSVSSCLPLSRCWQILLSHVSHMWSNCIRPFMM